MNTGLHRRIKWKNWEIRSKFGGDSEEARTAARLAGSSKPTEEILRQLEAVANKVQDEERG